MAVISVVVPIYNVEDYLDECLRSLAAQTHADFEAVLVDDGSTDASAAIAARFADRDTRFRVVSQTNGGLSRARNAGIDAAGGEYLAFLDSDDVLPPDAYERLLGALACTGSDFATGNVQRLTAGGCTQAAFLAGAFGRTRLRTHVRRFAPLLEDRTAWNKLWRRSFWDERALRFPDGKLHEDIPVVLPAHFQACSVDVIGAPVYRYRVRDVGPPSITQRRHELRALRDRLHAVEAVRAYVAEHESPRQLRRYERSALAHDLRYHLDLLLDADEEYRTAFMTLATAFLNAAGSRAYAGLPAVERAKYQLIQDGHTDALLELLAFQRDLTLRTPPRRRHSRYYAGYPLPDGVAPPRLGRRDRELALTAHLADIGFENGRLRLSGHAYVNALGAAAPDSQRVDIAAVRPGRRRALRMRLAPLRLATRPVRRADLEPRLRWAGFEAAIAPAALLGDVPARWELFASVRTGGLRRRRAVFIVEDPALVRTVDLPASRDQLVRAVVSADGRLTIEVAARWARIEQYRRIGTSLLELSGHGRLPRDASLLLTLTGECVTVRFPVAVSGRSFTARIDVGELRAVAAAPEARWDLAIVVGTQRPAFSLGEHLSGAAWRSGGHEMRLERTSDGGGRLIDLQPAPTHAAFAPDGEGTAVRLPETI